MNLKTRGFTLIEMMVVVLIIALLAGAVIVNVDVARKKSRDSKRIADIGLIATALQSYYADNHAYPVTVTPLSDTGWKYDKVANWVPGLVPTYLSVLPKDPINDYPPGNYTYWYNSDGANYKILVWTMESPDGNAMADNDGGNRNSTVSRDGHNSYELFSPGFPTSGSGS